jgi:hypothetical protein
MSYDAIALEWAAMGHTCRIAARWPPIDMDLSSPTGVEPTMRVP